jgi:hypothetical protein
MLAGCPGDGSCSGRGSCTNGVCACNAGYHGVDCGLDAGGSTGLRPGLRAEYFIQSPGTPTTQDRPLRQLDFVQAVPAISADWGISNNVVLPSGTITAPDAALEIVYSGELRVFRNDSVLLKCSFGGLSCAVFVNGSPVSESQPVPLIVGKNSKLQVVYKVRVAHCSGRSGGKCTALLTLVLQPQALQANYVFSRYVELQWQPSAATAFTPVPAGALR